MASGETIRWSYECSPLLSTIFVCVKNAEPCWRLGKLSQSFSDIFHKLSKSFIIIALISVYKCIYHSNNTTLLLFEGMYCKQNAHCFFPWTLRVKFSNLDVISLCCSEKLPAAGNLTFILEGNDLIWNEQGFPPQIQRAGLTILYMKPNFNNCSDVKGLRYFY